MKGEREKRGGELGVKESVSVRERDGEQKELQTKTSRLPCADLMSVFEGYFCRTIFGEILQKTQQQVSVEGGMCGREAAEKEEDGIVASSWLRQTKRRGLFLGCCMISKLMAHFLLVECIFHSCWSTLISSL